MGFAARYPSCVPEAGNVTCLRDLPKSAAESLNRIVRAALFKAARRSKNELNSPNGM
jgi:hypothetical protein